MTLKNISKKSAVAIVTVSVLVLGLFITLYQVGQQQNLQQRANQMNEDNPNTGSISTSVCQNACKNTSKTCQKDCNAKSGNDKKTCQKTCKDTEKSCITACKSGIGGAPTATPTAAFAQPTIPVPQIFACTNPTNVRQAICTWSALAGVTGYNVTVTELSSNSAVLQQQIPSNTTFITFPATAGKSYTCVVKAVNACGMGNPTQDSVACPAPPTPTPTPTAKPTPLPTSTLVPTMTPVPTTTPVPTAAIVQQPQPTQPIGGPPLTAIPTIPPKVITPIPSIVPTGDVNTTVMTGAAGLILTIIGGLVFFLL